MRKTSNIKMSRFSEVIYNFKSNVSILVYVEVSDSKLYLVKKISMNKPGKLLKRKIKKENQNAIPEIQMYHKLIIINCIYKNISS